MNWKRILVPTDFSAASRTALPYAIGIAKEMDAALTVVHVVPSNTPATVSHIGFILEQKHLLKHARTAIETLRAEEIPEDLSCETIVLNGAPAAEICAVAKSFDLIVIATHGRTGLSHFLIGSVAEKVLRHSPCPVLAVRDYPGWIITRDGNPILADRILVPTDFSGLSKGAIARAVQLAKRFRARIDLLHVVEPPLYPEFGYPSVPLKDPGLPALFATHIDKLSREIPALKDSLDQTLVRTGSVAHEILQAALVLNSDLIVMATHARKGLKHFFLGSNAEKVLRHAHCPVLLFPARK